MDKLSTSKQACVDENRRGRPSVPASRPAPYEVVVSLGGGRMGDLLLASRRDADGFRRLCVVKQLRRMLAIDASLRELFLREGRIASRLKHPNVVSTLGVGEHNGALYIAMEYLEGQTLRSVMTAMSQGSFAADTLLWVRVFSDVLAGLHHAHELRGEDGAPLGLVHRDVSPYNVFVTYEGRVVLIDFGSAKLTAEASRVDSGTIHGRRGYAAPELIAGEPSDRRTDIFSAGIVLWELLAERRLPYAVHPPNAHPPIPDVRSFRGDVDPRLAAIVAKAVEVDPSQRYPTAMAMRDALEAYADAVGRMRRRSELASLMSVLFEEERQHAHDEVRERLAKLEARPSGVERTRGREKPRLELIDEEDVADADVGRSEWAVLSAADIIGSENLERALASFTEIESSDVSSALGVASGAEFTDAVSVPAGPETEPPQTPLAEERGDALDASYLLRADVPTRIVPEVETEARCAFPSGGIPPEWAGYSEPTLGAVASAAMIDLPRPLVSVAAVLGRASGLDIPIAVIAAMPSDDAHPETPRQPPDGTG